MDLVTQSSASQSGCAADGVVRRWRSGDTECVLYQDGLVEHVGGPAAARMLVEDLEARARLEGLEATDAELDEVARVAGSLAALDAARTRPVARVGRPVSRERDRAHGRLLRRAHQRARAARPQRARRAPGRAPRAAGRVAGGARAGDGGSEPPPSEPPPARTGGGIVLSVIEREVDGAPLMAALVRLARAHLSARLHADAPDRARS